MASHPSSPSVVFAGTLVAAALAVAGCRVDQSPRRVPDDGAPCSAIMPGAPESGEAGLRLGSVALTERAWILRQPDADADPAKPVTQYVIRRAAVPAESGLRETALLDAAAARVGRGVALQNETKATVAKVATDAGQAVELRWATGTRRSATRLLLIPGGYCEATILDAPGDGEIASYFASVRVRP